MIKIILKALSKIVVAGIIALALLNLFSYFYFKMPVTIVNKDGSTDYKYESDVFYIRGVEGFGWGKTNNDGFMNMFDYSDDMKIDILIIGSSQMEALQVDMSQSTASKLNSLLENEIVYNIGVSSHTFLVCASNYRAALNKYQPTKYIVLETSTVSFSDEEIALAISEETPELHAHKIGGKILDLLQRNPYPRLIKYQINLYAKYSLARDIEEAESRGAFAESDTAASEDLLDDLLQKISVLAEGYGAKVIIVYHPQISIVSNGTINLIDDQNTTNQFKRLCDDNGILFLDMSNRFKEEYESAYILPYGFSNSPVGEGHLNKYGHAMIADELYNLILEEEQ